MSILNPCINDAKTTIAICPKCAVAREFKIIETAMSLIMPQVKYHKKRTAVCLSCNTVYEVNENNQKHFSLTPYNMKEKPERQKKGDK